MTDREYAYIVSRTLENKIMFAENNGQNTLLVTLDVLKDILALLKEQNWISVNYRLPNCNGCYLVWRPHFYPDKGMPSICYFDGQNTWHDSYGVDFTRTLAHGDVSHWKPLPDQP